jgi:lysine 2,3-aminomutase
LSQEQLLTIAKFCGNEKNSEHLREVLITVGDPLIIPQQISYIAESLQTQAPNIKRIRIGSRLVLHDRDRINYNVYSIFEGNEDIDFEIAFQVNHPQELFPEDHHKISEIQKRGVKIYSQNVLLKGVNDDHKTLINLYDTLRELNIEPHYLFHCISMKTSITFELQ